jgi:hypothetical protein
MLLTKYREQANSSNAKGHALSQRQYFKSTYCGICSETLWDSRNIGFECSCTFCFLTIACRLICHKACRAQLDISCINYSRLKNVPPMYFMAVDIADRARWLAGLQYYRQELEARLQWNRIT